MVAFDLNQIQTDFIRYAKVNTRSDAGSTTVPTTPGQTTLANMLVGELQALGLTDAALNPANGFVTATIPATTSKAVPSIGFIAHLDTADYAADDVAPQLHPNYQGAPIQFANGLALTVEQFPGLRRYFGETLITGDGTTLLGVDDKAGIAAAMALARVLVAEPTIEHGVVKLAFGPDEEIGKGADRFDAKGFATDFAYTLDNGDLGQIEYETFNAAQAVVTFTGTSVHPGEAKGSLVNALTLAERLDAALPTYERPEYTADKQGFFLLLELSGTIGTAQARYIIRDFGRANFAARKATLAQAVASLNAGFAEPRISYTLEDQYYNMADIIAKDQTPLRLAEAGIRAVGLTPHTISFRGGTDGSKITYQGIPTPNLFNGGMNFHGPYEVVSTEAMGKVAETLLAIVKLNAEN